jgi:hypothetical protein
LYFTGQFHKGGRNNGLFIQITGDDVQDLPIPGEPYSFSILKQAQALGDLQSLRSHGPRVMRVHFRRHTKAGLELVLEGVYAALGKAGSERTLQVT